MAITASKATFQICFVIAVLSGTFLYFNADIKMEVAARHLYASPKSNEMTLRLQQHNTTVASPSPNQLSSIPPNKNPYTVLKRGRYIKPGDLDVAIVTAVLYKHFPAKNGFNVFLNGWARYQSDMRFKCCFIGHADTKNIQLIETQAALYHIYNQWRVDMQNAEFSCSVSGTQLERLQINADAINHVTLAQDSCKHATMEALKIERRKVIPRSVAICLKISYGSLDPQLVVEWFEFQKIMGVTKVYSFLSEDLKPDARKVFEYYASTGFLEADPIYPAPSKKGKPRSFVVDRWHQQAWVDEVMAINDCKHRMSGMDFVIVHDIDEYIIPKLPEDNIYTILSKTLKAVPRAGAFSFDSHIAMLDWGPTRSSPLRIMRATNLTIKANYDGFDRNSRWAFISDRIFFGQNNKAWPRMKYTQTEVNNKYYTLMHRRMCKQGWTSCKSQNIRQRNDSILRYEALLLHNLQRLPLWEILGTNSTQYIQGIQAGEQLSPGL